MTEPEPAPSGVSWLEFYADYAAPKHQPYARRLVDLAPPRPGDQVLDVATGPGLVAIEAARRAPALTVVASDASPNWEPFVERAAREAGVAGIAFRATAAEDLAFPDASFDVVYCQFGLMFVDDLGAALREMRRVLRPGGRLGAAAWSVPERVNLFAPLRAMQAALPPEAEDEEPIGTAAFRLSEPGLLARLVAAAGFEAVVEHLITERYEIFDPSDEWRRISAEAGFAARLAKLSAAERAEARRRMLGDLERFREGDRLVVPSEAVLVAATRPPTDG